MSIRQMATDIGENAEHDWWLIPRFHLEPGHVVPRPGQLIFKDEEKDIVRLESKSLFYVRCFYANDYYYARIK